MVLSLAFGILVLGCVAEKIRVAYKRSIKAL